MKTLDPDPYRDYLLGGPRRRSTTPTIERDTERARQMINDFLDRADDLTPIVITNPDYQPSENL